MRTLREIVALLRSIDHKLDLLLAKDKAGLATGEGRIIGKALRDAERRAAIR